MATLGFLRVAPEERLAEWTLARADVEAATAGMSCEEFSLLGHTWCLHLYPDAQSTTGAATAAPCSLMVESKETGHMKATVTLNGVAQSLDHVFGSGARAILQWPGWANLEPMALVITFHLSSVGDEAWKRATGELLIVQQLEYLKAERADLQVRVAALSDELQGVREELAVSETGRSLAEQQAAELAVVVSKLETKAAVLEKDLEDLPGVRASLAEQQSKNEFLTAERSKLQEDLRDLQSDHEILTQRFELAQELKAKSEVVAFHAETAKADIEGKYSVQAAQFQAIIDVVQSEKLSLQAEVAKLKPAVEGLSFEKQQLEQHARQLQEERHAASSQVRSMQAERGALVSRVQDLEREEAGLKSKVSQYEKKKAKGWF